jgi:predicted transposase YdaD
MKKDIITKDIIKTITYDIAKHILNIKLSPNFKFVDKELQTIEKREADIVALCKIDNIKQILHIEIQNSNDNTMPRRMLRYYNDIKIRFKTLKIKQYIIYIGKDKLTMKNNIKEDNLNFNYDIIDMHDIDCEKLIKLDSPDALVLSILCDFKGKEELEVLTYITKRLQELTKDDEHKLGKYMLIMETLSQNRNLKDKLRKAEDMLRTTKYEDLPSYDIGMERGIEQGIQRGIEQGIQRGMEQGMEQGILHNKIKNAIIMVKDFNLNPKDVATKLEISLDELLSHLN